MAFIDDLLNRITMYRLVLYELLTLMAIAAIFGAFGMLPINPLELIVSAVIILTACWIVNIVFARVFRVPANNDSFYITAFILTLIISPISFSSAAGASFWAGFAFLVWASIFAMASKYILAINKKHIFNPAAIAVVLTGFFLNQYASWWVCGNLPMLAFILIGGFLVVRKIQRFDLVLAFLAVSLASIAFTSLSFGNPLSTILKVIVHTPLLFFASIMLTEPFTTPPTRPLRIAYGALIGALFSPAIHIGSIYSTPELALVVGNIFSFAASPKGKYILKLREKKEVAANVHDFSLAPDDADNRSGRINFRPGQYMEWTIDGSNADARGNRRYFTIASSPTEPNIHLGIKFYENSSTFKKKLRSLKPGDSIVAGQLAGDFTLPHGFAENPAGKKLVFVAGGIGITPFRSMVKYLSDRPGAGKFDIILLYSNRSASEIAYRDVFDKAAQTIGLKTFYINTDSGTRIDSGFLRREIPDHRERVFYLSGPHSMVVAFQKTLYELGVPRRHIKTDFFPGFV